MGVETSLFLDDRFHSGIPSSSIRDVSTTANGYHIDNIRETDWKTAWKPNDGTVDEYVTIDGGSAGWLGGAGAFVRFVIAYDARGADQTSIIVTSDAADDPVSGTFAQVKSTFALSKLGPTVQYDETQVSSPGKRYYQLRMESASRGGGTKTVRIFAFSVYVLAGIHRIGTDDTNATAPGSIGLDSGVGTFRSIPGLVCSNRNGSSAQSFDLPFSPLSKATWVVLRNTFFDLRGPARAFYVEFEGLRNYAQADFQMVRLDGPAWGSGRGVRDELDTTIPLRTEAWV